MHTHTHLTRIAHRWVRVWEFLISSGSQMLGFEGSETLGWFLISESWSLGAKHFHFSPAEGDALCSQKLSNKCKVSKMTKHLSQTLDVLISQSNSGPDMRLSCLN